MSITKYDGKQVYEMISTINKLDSEIKKYFHFDCLIWKAIFKHIADSDDCVIVKKDKGNIKCYRGTGPSISMRDYHKYCTQYDKNNKPHEPDVFSFEICVEYEDLDNCEGEWKRQYDIIIPLELLTDFTQKKFDDWIEALRTKRDNLQRTLDIDKLKELMELYPEVNRKE
jgi:hypothetical protein